MAQRSILGDDEAGKHHRLSRETVRGIGTTLFLLPILRNLPINSCWLPISQYLLVFSCIFVFFWGGAFNEKTQKKKGGINEEKNIFFFLISLKNSQNSYSRKVASW